MTKDSVTGRFIQVRSIEARFWEKVDKTNECWNWTRYKDPNGYGRFQLGKEKYIGAHRFAYELSNGPIPKGLVLDHLCRNPSCVRPEHLEAVPQQINVLRGNGPTSVNAQKTYCIHGHLFDETNTYWEPRGRACRKCRAAAQRAYTKRQKA